ncbi:MAG: PTS sugar transporter subunit IIA [Pseudomonadota bacterium]
MRLDEYVDSELLISDLSASTHPFKEDVLAELVGLVCARYENLDAKNILQVLHDRESLGSTGIGDGIAIPHAKIFGLEKMILVVARSIDGVAFEALDARPVRAVFMVLAPENAVGMHLRLLAHVSRLLKDKEFRQTFMQATDHETLFALLAKS